VARRVPYRDSAAQQGQGLGELLLMDAIKRVCNVRGQVGVFALFVDAKDEDAAFYSKYGFTALPQATRIMVLPLNQVCEPYPG
jgi:citrate lyase synthetase